MKRFAEQHDINDENLLFVNQANIGFAGEKKFVISSQWWRKWCDYANFGETMELGTFVNFNNLS